MSNKLPLLTTKQDMIPWSYVKPYLCISDEDDEFVLQIPIGMKDTGEVIYAKLSSVDECQHMYLGGVAASGKSLVLRWIMAALTVMYKKDIRINIIDGKGTLADMWLDDVGKPVFPNMGIVKHVTYVNGCRSALDEVKSYIWNKDTSDAVDIVVLDDVDYLLNKFTPEDTGILMDILWGGPKKNAHVIYTSQSFAELFGEPQCQRNLFDFSVICMTSATLQGSLKMLDSIMAYANTRDIGDIVLRTKDDIQLLRVPYINDSTFLQELKKVYNT